MLFGAAQLNITPPLPFYLAGTGLPRLAREVHDPLFVSALYVEEEGHQLLFISCDLLNVKDEFAKAVRHEIEKQTGIPYGHIFLSATHTHSGPKTGQNVPLPWLETPKALIAYLHENIVACAQNAFNHRQKGFWGYEKGTAEGCGFNRRLIGENGRVFFAKRQPYGALVHPEGPVDHDLHALWVVNEKHEIMAVLVNFACHPVTMSGNELVSADFPGRMRAFLQNAVGKAVPILFMQGCSGNINTSNYMDLEVPCIGVEGINRIGRVLAGETLKLIFGRPAKQDEAKIDVYSEMLNAKRVPIEKEEALQVQKAWDALSEEEKSDENRWQVLKDIFFPLQLAREYAENPVQALEISVIRLGDIAILTCPVEWFVEYQLELKRRFPQLKLMIFSITNGHGGYAQTRLAHALGGYETNRTLSVKFEKETGMELFNLCESMLKQSFPNQYEEKDTTRFI